MSSFCCTIDMSPTALRSIPHPVAIEVNPSKHCAQGKVDVGALCPRIPVKLMTLTWPKLPDFMLALESWNRDSMQQRASSPLRVIITPERPSSRTSSRASQNPGKLRYTAYEAPKPTARLRRISSNSSFAHSDTSRFVGQDTDDPLSRTVTAGQLALAVEQIELQALTKVG